MQKKTANPAARKPRVKKVLTHQVRIIGGQWKRTPLPVLEVDGLRPTPDRVRETVFNWLGHLFDHAWERVACLDLFAGTGALGFEAASRGAARVVMVEANTGAFRQLQQTQEKLRASNVNIIRGDAAATALGMLGRLGASQLEEGRFQLIFLDPPFNQDWLPKILPTCAQLLVDGGLLYAESEQAFDNEALPVWLDGWQVVRADKAGMVFYHLLQRKGGQ